MKYFNWYECFAIASGIILSLTYNGTDYQSEWSTDHGFVLTVFLMILVSVGISFLSTSIFLNQIRFVKDNVWLCLLCWFLPPGVPCVAAIYQETSNFTGSNNFNGVYEGSRLLDTYLLLIAVIHLTCLFVGWVNFRRAIIAGNQKVAK